MRFTQQKNTLLFFLGFENVNNTFKISFDRLRPSLLERLHGGVERMILPEATQPGAGNMFCSFPALCTKKVLVLSFMCSR